MSHPTNFGQWDWKRYILNAFFHIVTSPSKQRLLPHTLTCNTSKTEWWTGRPQSSDYSATKNMLYKLHRDVCGMRCCVVPLQISNGSRKVREVVKKRRQNISHLFIVWEKIWAQSAVPTALKATHKPPTTLRNNTSWINMGLPADEYLLLCEFIYPLRWNQPLWKHFNFWEVVFDLDKHIFPWQTCSLRRWS